MTRRTRLLASALAAMLYGCADPHAASTYSPTSESTMLQRVESAQAKGDWNYVYQQIEESLTNNGTINKASALAIYAKNSESIRMAGYERILEIAAQGTAPDYAQKLTVNYETVTQDKAGAQKLRAMSSQDAKNSQINAKLMRLERAKNALTFGEVTCLTSSSCEKAFAITQIYISTHADMKIHTATSYIIETYGATKLGSIAFKATRTPNKQGEAIRLIAQCSGLSADVALSTNAKDTEQATRCINILESIKTKQPYTQFVKDRL